jgi:transcription antitermination factor NusG
MGLAETECAKTVPFMDNRTTQKDWLVAYVQSNREKKTAERLTLQGIEHFLPLQRVTRQWSDRRKEIDQVVVPMCIFVRVARPERLQVLRTPSVNRFMVLRGENTPAIIPPSQMERFMFMLDYSKEAVEMRYEPLAAGEKIRVIKGPLAGLEGELVNVDGRNKVAVRIDILGVAMVEVPVGFVEKME